MSLVDHKVVWQVQHTCENRGSDEQILEDGPFFALHDPDNEHGGGAKEQFLGSGYYFWLENLELANYWGRSHCKNNYRILQCEIEYNYDDCLDLVVNMRHLRLVQTLIHEEVSIDKSKEAWALNQWIEHFKQMDSKKDIGLDFNVILAIDETLPKEIKPRRIRFRRDISNHTTLLNPKLMLCVIDKNSVNLRDKTVLEPTRH